MQQNKKLRWKCYWWILNHTKYRTKTKQLYTNSNRTEWKFSKSWVKIILPTKLEGCRGKMIEKRYLIISSTMAGRSKCWPLKIWLK